MPSRYQFLLFVVLGSQFLGLAAANETSVYPAASWSTAAPESLGMRTASLSDARDYALSGGGSGIITRRGQIVMSWGDTRRKFDLKSSSKSIGITSLGLAIDDGKMALSDLATSHHPAFGVPPDSNRTRGWIESITLRRLANQTAISMNNPG